MFRNPLMLPAALLLGTAATAQVDFLVTNIGSAAGNYRDVISLHDGTNIRPLAQETRARSGTGSVRKMKFRTDNGRPYLYWLDTISDDIWRATDRNKNGALDPSEFEQVYDFTAASEGQLDEMQGIWWSCIGAGSGTSVGLWKHQDGNADGDFADAGESTKLIAGPTFSFGTSPVYTASSDDMRAVAILPNGDVIWHEDDNQMWFRTTPAGATSVWLVYKTPAIITPLPPVNPDFGTALPAITSPMDRVGVNQANGDVFLAPNFSVTAGERYVFLARDKNSDGDVNDAGECTMFFDGVASTPKWGPVDDIEFFAGSVWVSYEIDTVADPGCQFVGLRDVNNDGDAMDPGELTNMGRTATTDDPTVIGISVAPKAVFAPGCVNLDLSNGSDLSTGGGTLSYALNDIPSTLWNDTTVAYTFFSVTGDATLPIPMPPYTCVIGLTPDIVFATFAGLFVTPVITTRSVATAASIPYPPGLPLGLKVYAASVAIRGTDFMVRGVSQTAYAVVK
jgi:hypothetical protein